MTSSSSELSTSRVLNASRDLVHRAFSDPAHLAQWWGPAGFSNEFEVCEFKPGGVWRFVMVGPDGARYRNDSEFVETSNSRIVVKHLSAPHFTLSITLTNLDTKTRIDWCQRFESAEVCARIRVYAGPGNEQNLDRLEALLQKIS